MNKIILIASGKFNSVKLITALQRMIIDPSKETVRSIYLKDMPYVVEGKETVKHEDFFMAQIVDNECKWTPTTLYFNDKDGRQREICVSGIVDEKQVLESGIIDKYFTGLFNEKVRKNPDKLIMFLSQKMNARELRVVLSEYGIDSLFSIVNMNPNHARLNIRTTGDFVCYYKTTEKEDLKICCNSKEVLEDLGFDCHQSMKGLEVIDRYSPIKSKYTSWIGANRDKDLPTFTTGVDVFRTQISSSIGLTYKEFANQLIEFQRQASKCTDNQTLTFKKKD